MRGRLRLWGGLDLLLAALHGWVGTTVAPARSALIQAAVVALAALLGLAGLALLAGLGAARRIAIAAAWALLAAGAITIAALVTGAAYLHGVYGALGEGMAWISVVVAALIVEVTALPAIAQLRFLERDEVRRHFGAQ